MTVVKEMVKGSKKPGEIMRVMTGVVAFSFSYKITTKYRSM